MKVNLKQEGTGLVKQVKVGFSWTTFFWDSSPPYLEGIANGL